MKRDDFATAVRNSERPLTLTYNPKPDLYLYLYSLTAAYVQQ